MAVEQPKLYTEQDVRAAMSVGIGLARNTVPLDRKMTQEEWEKAIEQAYPLFAGSHGVAAPNYTLFKELHESHDWRGLAEAHIAAAHMAASEAAPHALVALACIGRELLDEFAHIGGILDARSG